MKLILPKCCENLEIDAVQDIFWGVELNKKHDEDAMIWQLLKLCVSHLMILK